MKLEVGMYVRNKNGLLGKLVMVKESDNGVILKYAGHYEKSVWSKFGTDSETVTASHNIKELLQVGDIITYEFPTGLGMLKYENVTILEDLLDVLKSSDEYEILSIVTKEQFSQMEYKVGE